MAISAKLPAMPQTDAQVLDDLKTARDALLSAVAGGRMTVRYKIGTREHETKDPVAALKGIEDLIEMYETKANRDSGSARNYVKFTRRP